MISKGSVVVIWVKTGYMEDTQKSTKQGGSLKKKDEGGSHKKRGMDILKRKIIFQILVRYFDIELINKL